MVAKAWVEWLIGRMAESEVQISFQKSSKWYQYKRLKCHYSPKTSQVALDGWPRVTVAPLQYKWPNGQNDQMFDVIQQKLEQRDFFEMRQYQSRKWTEKPGSPCNMQPPQDQTAIIANQQYQQHSESDMAGIKNKEPTFGSQLTVQRQQQTRQANPEASLLNPIRLQVLLFLFFGSQRVPPEPAEEDRKGPKEDADGPVVEGGNLRMTIISSKLSNA